MWCEKCAWVGREPQSLQPKAGAHPSCADPRGRAGLSLSARHYAGASKASARPATTRIEEPRLTSAPCRGVGVKACIPGVRAVAAAIAGKDGTPGGRGRNP